MAGQAQTGTGKTAAFLIALFNRLLTDPGAPQPAGQRTARHRHRADARTRRADSLRRARASPNITGLKLAIVFGGVDYEKQRRILEQGVDVLIGTPGRIIDYFKQHVFDLRHIQVAVMDEADRMFDLGFIKDIRFILRRLPHPTHRLNMMFSATLSYRVLELAYEHMNNPELIRIEPDKMTVDRVRQVLYFPSTEEKIPLLMGLLRRIDARRTMVFVNTRRIAEVLERTLDGERFRRTGAVGRRAAEQAPEDDARLPQRRCRRSDRHRRRIAGPAHSRREPCVQFRSAERCRRLRAPHRAHGARRRRGRRHQLRLRGIRDLVARHRALHRPPDSARGDRRRRSGRTSPRRLPRHGANGRLRRGAVDAAAAAGSGGAPRPAARSARGGRSGGGGPRRAPARASKASRIAAELRARRGCGRRPPASTAAAARRCAPPPRRRGGAGGGGGGATAAAADPAAARPALT